MPELKMFVWEDVLCDWSCGMIVVLAHDVNEARKLANEDLGYPDDAPCGYLTAEPLVVTEPRAYHVWGGG